MVHDFTHMKHHFDHIFGRSFSQALLTKRGDMDRTKPNSKVSRKGKERKKWWKSLEISRKSFFCSGQALQFAPGAFFYVVLLSTTAFESQNFGLANAVLVHVHESLGSFAFFRIHASACVRIVQVLYLFLLWLEYPLDLTNEGANNANRITHQSRLLTAPITSNSQTYATVTMFSPRTVAGVMRLSKPTGLFALYFFSVLRGLSPKCTNLVSRNPSFQPPIQTTFPIPALKDPVGQVLVYMDMDLFRHITEIRLFLESHAEVLEQPAHHELVVGGLDFRVVWVPVGPCGICLVNEILGMAADVRRWRLCSSRYLWVRATLCVNVLRR